MTTDQATVFAAWFGAAGAVGTIALFLFEIFKYWKTKPHLKIVCRFNQEILNQHLDGRVEKDHKLGDVWSIRIINPTNSDIILQSVAIETHQKKGCIIDTDSVGNRPFRQKVVAGDSYALTISEKLISSKKAKIVIVQTAVGDEFKKRLYFWQKK